MLKMLLVAAALLSAPLAKAETQSVVVDNYAFMPGVVVIHRGDVVSWTNKDSIPHTATALDGKSFDSGAIDPDASWSFAFKTPGVYKYRCAIHPDMRGEIDVQ